MMCCVKKFSLVSAAFGLAMLAACGDENTTEVTEQTVISMLEAGKSMPECDSESAGNMVYAADSAEVYFCTDGKWLTLNGKDGADGKDGANGKTPEVKHGIDCSVGDPSTDKDGNTVVAITCGEISKTLTIAKGGPGDDGVECKAVDEGEGKIVVTCGEGDSKTEQVLYKAMCGGVGYEPAETFCFGVEIYDLCDAQSYNPDKQYCLTLKDEKGTEKETIEDLLIDNRNKDNVQVYKTVKICDEEKENCWTWMAQNLNYVPDPDKVSSMGEYAWSGCYGDGVESFTEEQVAANCAKYGRLYTWEVAMDNADCAYDKRCNAFTRPEKPVQGICPEGWHLPSYKEFREFLNFIDPSFGDEYDNQTSLTAGKYLKASSGWNSSGNGTDAYGFSALPSGSRRHDRSFFNSGYDAYIWSSSEDGDRRAFRLYLFFNEEKAYFDSDDKSIAGSVRCVKN